MAELNLGKGLTAGKVASNVQKKLTRAQEKVRGAARLQMVGGLHVSLSLGPPSDRASAALLPHRPGAVSHHDLH